MSLVISTPWNLSHGILAGGYDPLYEPLFDSNPSLEFCTVDELKLIDALCQNANFWNWALQRDRPWAPAEGFPIEAGLRFATLVPEHNLILQDMLPGAVEFHQSVPLTLGQRPFVLHCESLHRMMTMFLLETSEADFERSFNHARTFYRWLLAQENCLGVFSHRSDTLAELSHLMKSTEVDRKLKSSRIGITRRAAEILTKDLPTRRAEHPVFLFALPDHLPRANFGQYGGYAVLKFAESFLRGQRRGRFLFRCARPDDASLREHGIDVTFLDSECDKSIHWVDHYHVGAELTQLIALADFLLAPGSELWSSLLMQALAGGTIPVVADIPGVSRYVNHSKTGVVLPAIPSHSGGSFSRYVAREESEHVATLADAIFTAITDLLDASDRLRSMADAAARFASVEFNPDSFQESWTDALISQVTAHHGRLPAAMEPRSEIESVIRRNDFARYFRSPSSPALCLDVGYARVFRCRGLYWAVASPLLQEADKSTFFDPVQLFRHGHLQSRAVAVAADMAQLGEFLYGANLRSYPGPRHPGSSSSRSRFANFLRMRPVLRPIENVLRRLRRPAPLQ